MTTEEQLRHALESLTKAARRAVEFRDHKSLDRLGGTLNLVSGVLDGLGGTTHPPGIYLSHAAAAKLAKAFGNLSVREIDKETFCAFCDLNDAVPPNE